MEPSEYAPLLSAVAIVLAALLVGPVLGIPASPSDSEDCGDERPIGTGNASVSVTDLPDRAVIERNDYGSELYTLSVGDARLTADDVQGRPTVTYKFRVDLEGGSRALASTAILSRCTELSGISIRDSTLEPDRVEAGSYPGTITVTYRGSEGGEDVTTELATENVTVTVRE